MQLVPRWIQFKLKGICKESLQIQIEGTCAKNATVRNFRIVQMEGRQACAKIAHTASDEKWGKIE